MKYVIVSMSVVMFCLFGAARADLPNVWINEFHYDNAGTDVGEFVEVCAPADFTALSAVTLTFYNGSDGKKYGTAKLNSFAVGQTVDGFTFYYLDKSGLQNGAPDGFGLDYNGAVIQLLSYEGDFVAEDGAAAGYISVDVGVVETEDTPAGYSIQLQGNGTQYNHFAWAGPMAATKGAPNFEQALPVSLSSFSACYENRVITLNWRTESETDNLGFVLDRRGLGEPWQRRASYITHNELKGQGTTARATAYTFVDDRIESGQTYEYQLRDCNISGVLGRPVLLTIAAVEQKMTPMSFELAQNYPNPFNPSTTIRFNLPERESIQLTVYDALGLQRQVLLQGMVEKGAHSVVWHADDLPAGVYWYELRSASNIQIRKAVLLR